jgi:exosortase A
MNPFNSAAVRGWRLALPALLLCLAWILFWYRDTAIAMVTIWARSGTFAHAFLVPPISLWLIWRQRHALATLSPRASLPVLILLALAGFIWLLGDLAAVNAVTQLALVSLLVLAVPAVLGMRVAAAMMFPLAFLFFAVPIGEFVMPQMMVWTADFTVRALTLSGIPVYREGLQFVIPSGNWSVVEACSGVRYLIASVTVGTLYAYLSYRSLGRRLIFVGVSILVPIVANWMRAYMIVMLGHLSGNKLAVGVDHLIYGWVFFGVVILLMFMIGARWAEDPDADECVANIRPDTGVPQTSGRVWVAAALLAVVTVLPHAWHSIIERNETSRAGALPSLALPAPPGWVAADSRVIGWRPAFANPTAELRTEFVQGERRVGVFIGYYRQQDYEHKLVSSTNTLVLSTDPDWAGVASGSRSASVGEQSLAVRTAELRGASGQRLAVWQWYWLNGRLTTSDYVAKVWTAFGRLMGQGDDSAVVILYAPNDSPGGGEAALEAFAKAAGTTIEAALGPGR